MKLHERQDLLQMLEQGQIKDAIAYIKDCTKDYCSQKSSAKERNIAWAKNHKKANSILDMPVGGSKIVDVDEISRGTISCVACYGHPDRKYKILKVSETSFVVVRTK